MNFELSSNVLLKWFAVAVVGFAAVRLDTFGAPAANNTSTSTTPASNSSIDCSAYNITIDNPAAYTQALIAVNDIRISKNLTATPHVCPEAAALAEIRADGIITSVSNCPTSQDRAAVMQIFAKYNVTELQNELIVAACKVAQYLTNSNGTVSNVPNPTTPGDFSFAVNGSSTSSLSASSTSSLSASSTSSLSALSTSFSSSPSSTSTSSSSSTSSPTSNPH